MSAKTLTRIVSHMHKGAFRKKAQAAGESTAEYAEQEKHASGKTGAQARLALTLMKHRP